MDNFIYDTHEPLSPIFVEPILKARLAEIKALLATKLKELKKAPEGSLRIKKCKNTTQYYLRTVSDDTSGRYIPSVKLNLIKALAQKDYDKTVVAALKKESRLLQNALNGYNLFGRKITRVEKAFSKLSEARRKLVKPVCLPDENFAEIWQAIPYEKKPFLSNTPEFRTLQGERVRSKSEIIIADTLSRMNIPYRYEFPLEIKAEYGEKRTFFPDFLCLNLRTRQEFIWEHFGMMKHFGFSDMKFLMPAKAMVGKLPAQELHENLCRCHLEFFDAFLKKTKPAPELKSNDAVTVTVFRA